MERDYDPTFDALVQIALAGELQGRNVRTPEHGVNAVRVAEAAYQERALAWERIKQSEPTPGLSREVGRAPFSEEIRERVDEAQPGEEL